MDDILKKSESEQGPEEGPDSLRLDKDRQPTPLTSSNSDEDSGNRKEKRARNAGLNKEFFLSDLSQE